MQHGIGPWPPLSHGKQGAAADGGSAGEEEEQKDVKSLEERWTSTHPDS